MKSAELRETFLEFFAERNHEVVNSSSLVPDDPTILLTTAGMVQFKPYFLGEKPPSYKRATSVQRCVRTTDVESVGKTARHNTFFEMLGNFSFGDYYKESAIPWAWELLTEVFGINPGDLWISVFEEDEEAERIWKQISSVDPGRVIRLGAEDNFWDMGETGPCGPCSEILLDRGEKYSCGPDCAPGCDCDRFLELWNLVFMQYDRLPDGSLKPLPQKNIDTGLGLERLAAVKQNKENVFQTDLFLPIMEMIFEISGVKMGESKESDVSIKVIADHARASAFLISDGVIPSNEGRGYISRRLIRRALMHARLLGLNRPFLEKLAMLTTEMFGDTYEGLKENSRLIREVVVAEEKRFRQTLEQGVSYLTGLIADNKKAGKNFIDGDAAFYLHDTLGFPLELTREIAEESGLTVDEGGFAKLMKLQKSRARLSREHDSLIEEEVFSSILLEHGTTDFQGYNSTELETRICAIVSEGSEKVEIAGGSLMAEIVLENSPFYAESGGQIGDTGEIESPSGIFDVKETYYGAPGLIVHRGVLSGQMTRGQNVVARVDSRRRMDIAKNHSATHLLHWALRDVLGPHAKQAGSLVAPDILRFDFTHFKPLTEQEIKKIENLANEKVLEDVPVSTCLTTQKKASEEGAVALFGEKYGDEVRVVDIGGFSKELCGGIHVTRTGQIGLIKIVQESGIGAGLRRIEATSGMRSAELFRQTEETLEKAASLLKCSKDEIPYLIESLTSRLRELERLEEKERKGKAKEEASRILKKKGALESKADFVFEHVRSRDLDFLRELADTLIEAGAQLVALGSEVGERANLVVKISRDLARKGFDARELARSGGEILGGGGGGRKDMAQAGGGRVDMVDEALQRIESIVREGRKV
ncbi:MAG: alanine--tRNA ligase [Actinomycetota bacterium]|nr:alanine--tRNA ligase [Actinomycetota bacterium]